MSSYPLHSTLFFPKKYSEHKQRNVSQTVNLTLFFSFFFFSFFFSFCLPLREIKVRLQQPQGQRYPVLHVHAGAFSWFRNPPNSDTSYRIFNVRIVIYIYVIILMRACIHTGVWHTDSESAQLQSWRVVRSNTFSVSVRLPMTPRG